MPKPNFEIREAGPQDFEFAWTLYRDLMKPMTEVFLAWNDEKQRAVVTRDLDSGEARIIEAEGGEVGWLHVREAAAEIELCQLYLIPEMQNRGIGTAIVEDLVVRADGAAKAVTLEVLRNNRARQLYERLGFKVIGSGPIKIQMAFDAGDRKQ